MTLKVGVDLVILTPLMYVLAVVQLTQLIILASDHHHLHLPVEELLGGGAVHGRGAVGDQSLHKGVQELRGSKE